MKKYSLKNKIFYFYSILFILIITIVIMLVTVYIRNTFNEQAQSSLDILSERISDEFNQMIDDMDQIALQIYYAKNVSSILTLTENAQSSYNYFETHLNDEDAIQKVFFTILGADVSNTVINIFNKNAFVSTSANSISWEMLVKQREDGFISHIEQELKKTDSLFLLEPHSNYWSSSLSVDRKYFSVARKLVNSETNRDLGIIHVLKPVSQLDKLVVNADSKTHVFLFDQSYNIISPQLDNKDLQRDAENLLAEYAETPFKGGRHSVSSHTYIVSMQFADQYDFGIMVMQSYDKVSRLLRITMLMILVIAVLLLGLFIQLNFLASRALARPLQDIAKNMREVTWNNMEIRLNFDAREDEVQILQQSFDAMLARIRESINQVIEMKIHENKAYYIALQSQMTPHFLNNVISNISMLAYENGIPKIVDICKRLSNLLHYAADNSKINCTLGQELKYVRNYLDLMEMRYENKYTSIINFDDRCQDVVVPKLILQSVVENCFKHAFQQTPYPWLITISTYIKDDFWIVEVTDNGVGFPEEKAAKIQEQADMIYDNILNGISEIHIGGLGLVNSLLRLRLLYKNQAMFTVKTMYHGSIVSFGGALHAELN